MPDDGRLVELEVEVQIQGRVATWEPPHRVVFDGGTGEGWRSELGIPANPAAGERIEVNVST